MLDNIFSPIISATGSGSFPITSFLICTLVSLVLGLCIAFIYKYKNRATGSFLVTLALMPAIVQMIIMLVNGNLGTGVAVMGAFSLVRFRSVPGSAKEICSIFLAMAVGLATGIGYIGIAAVFVIIMGIAWVIYTRLDFSKTKQAEKQLTVTIPETLNYTEIFEDIFNKYTCEHRLLGVKTTNMGSLFKLSYSIVLLDETYEKSMIDEIRCRNGNLEISCCTFCGEQLQQL